MWSVRSIIFWITTKIRSLKDNYKQKSSKGKWEFIRKFINMLLYCEGLSILDRKFKVYWLSYLCGLLGADYIILTIYTIYKYRNDPLKAIEPTCLLGILIQALLVYALVMMPSRLKRLQNLVLFAGEFIYKDTYETEKHRTTGEKSVKHLMSASIKVFTVIGTSLICYLLLPAYAFFMLKQHPLPLPIELPFIDIETDLGYYINIGHQAGFSFAGMNGVLAIELMNCMFKNNIYAAKESIIYSLDVLGTMLQQDRTFSLENKSELKNILLKIQDLDRFIIEFRDLYYWKFFLQPMLLAYSVAASLLCYYVGDWISGAGVAVLCYSQIFILCDIGNEAYSANEELQAAMYALPWYLMPRKHALMVQHAMHRLQNGGIIRMGPLAALNYGTASYLTRSIYTFMMMLMRMVAN